MSILRHRRQLRDKSTLILEEFIITFFVDDGSNLHYFVCQLQIVWPQLRSQQPSEDESKS